jgi:hypothetical protein
MGAPLAIAAVVASVASTGIAAAGAISSAHAQSANANYQAQVARNNATTAAQNAEYATQAGQEKAQEARTQARQNQGAVTTALAANGLDVNTGTPEQVERTQRETSALGTQQIVDSAALQAYGYRTQGTGFQAESQLQQAEAGQATTAGAFGATGSLLSGAAGVGLNYVKLQQLGVFSGGGGEGSNVDTVSTF